MASFSPLVSLLDPRLPPEWPAPYPPRGRAEHVLIAPRNRLVDSWITSHYPTCEDYAPQYDPDTDRRYAPSALDVLGEEPAALEQGRSVVAKPLLDLKGPGEPAPDFARLHVQVLCFPSDVPASERPKGDSGELLNVSITPYSWTVNEDDLEASRSPPRGHWHSDRKPDIEAFFIPPPAEHPARLDPVQELSDNSAENRAWELWGAVQILRPSPGFLASWRTAGRPNAKSLAKEEKDKGKKYLTLDEQQEAARTHAELIWLTAYTFFTLYPGEEGVLMHPPEHPAGGNDFQDLRGRTRDATLRWGLWPPPTSWVECDNFKQVTGSAREVLAIPRSVFWQTSPPTCRTFSPWIPIAKHLWPSFSAASPTVLLPSGVLRDGPRAKPAPGSIVYQRYIPELKQMLSYRLIDAGKPLSGVYTMDVHLMAKWQNSDRVNSGWRQRSDNMAEHETFVRECQDAPDRWGLMGYWDDEPWGFVEIYWAKSSNVAPFYRVGDHDMGFHALVGEDHFRGAHRVRTWMGSAVHLCFLLDPRTELVVSEPRASNTKMVYYECMVGGHVEKLIDLGHKRSALVMIPRERFFQLCPLGPLSQHLPIMI